MRGRLTAFLGGALLRGLSCLSFAATQRLGKFVGDVAFFHNGALADVSRRNLTVCFPELTRVELDRLVRSSLRQMGCLSTELGIIWHGSELRWRRLVASVEGIDAIEDPQRLRKGVLVIAPHFGSWELLNLVLGSRFALTVLYDPLRIPEVNRLMSTARARSGSTLVATTAAGVRALYKVLKAGGVVGLLPDQVPARRAGLYARFFGRPALTMKLVYRLARKTNPSIVLAYAQRLPAAAGFRIVCKTLSAVDVSTGAEATLTEINRAIENLVRADPSQYLWAYKRFKRARSPSERVY